MHDLNVAEAASLLGVSQDTLAVWEDCYGFPTSQRSLGECRRFAYSEVAALHEALGHSMSVSAAVLRAREEPAGEVSSAS
jgi:DNA-binding transcriptional MerR regulator